jgi:hypothetical protein
MPDNSGIIPLILCIFIVVSGIGVSGCTSPVNTGADKKSGGVAPEKEWYIDHAVIIVRNLTATTDHFRDAGFNVTPGGVNPGNATHNALIPFSDGSYLELFAPVDPALSEEMQALADSGQFDMAMAGDDAMSKRFMLHFVNGTGPKDFALSAPGLNLTKEQIEAGLAGVVFDGPIAMSRVRSDGVLVKWQVDVPVGKYAVSMPFLIVDNTPRILRVPGGTATNHPNGATGIRSIMVSTSDAVAATRGYDAIFSSSHKSVTGRNITYDMNGSSIIVRSYETSLPENLISIVLKNKTGDDVMLDYFAIDGSE